MLYTYSEYLYRALLIYVIPFYLFPVRDISSMPEVHVAAPESQTLQ